MEAVRQVDSVTNTRDRTLQNRSQSKGKSSYHSIQKDTADLSPSAIALSREGMDINKSTVVQ
jgi:transposase